MLVGVLSAEVGDATRLRWVEVELEPLMAEGKVVHLETPANLILLIAKLSVLDF